MADSHVVSYRINNHDLPDNRRDVRVEASPEQARQLVDEGFVVRERLIQGAHLEALRAACDETASAHGAATGSQTSGTFGGLFVRSLLDRHPAFLEMLTFAPTLSLARAVLGPQVQVHAMVMRVTYPGQANQETHWHFHQRVIPEPVPPLFSAPHVIDNLIYLDDIDDATGPFCLIPRTHKNLHAELPAGDFGNKEGQVVVRVPAGSCITADAGLWHRAMPTLPHGRVRRLLILGYSPTWMKPIDRFEGELTKPLRENGDRETRELLGVGGYY